eukprot:CAMPEP_0172197372 /NCGR_PEP_ID=MMETSP1050-20130122/27419_1 /TAXON_ID=233186 /ORGANISM="Cryptomonas curvata, Strain CCAP979/52" /LENGTH=138 /DNA_ID=CAMNT_0012873923 /DNA_START=221 /DNA_END=633 /DNA_ORIENTATION=+
MSRYNSTRIFGSSRFWNANTSEAKMILAKARKLIGCPHLKQMTPLRHGFIPTLPSRYKLMLIKLAKSVRAKQLSKQLPKPEPASPPKTEAIARSIQKLKNFRKDLNRYAERVLRRQQQKASVGAPDLPADLPADLPPL